MIWALVGPRNHVIPNAGLVRDGAQSGLGPGPGWGPYGPIGALMGPKDKISFERSLILMKSSNC